MSCKVFVGNLPWRVTSTDLSTILNDQGYAHRGVVVIMDRDTGRSRGFAFVEVDTPQAAQEMIRDLNGFIVDGRPLRVNEADDKPRRGGGGGGRECSGGDRSRRGSGGGEYEWDDE